MSEIVISRGEPIIEARKLNVSFGEHHVLKGLDLDVAKGQVLGLVGGSGSGKSVLLRTLIGLVPYQSGTVKLSGTPLDKIAGQSRLGRFAGVLFQHGALFSSLSVEENVMFPMREHTELKRDTMRELAHMKLAMVGLPPEAAEKRPSELSGGMIKRAALARALALDPEIVFLDEPTAGLDPISAGAFDHLIATLKETLQLTVFMVTHDLDSLAAICDRIAVLNQGVIVADGALKDVAKVDHPWVKEYFTGPRARLAFSAYDGSRP